ncbi:hypothetical protein TFLX_02134 [Thermoflexales bacterium]|nr:hypothetical protein TFLX_02134 [Thermoflexales bacterium]
MNVQTDHANPLRFSQEAQTFVSIMHDLAPALSLDYTAQSIQALEQFIAQTFDPPGSRYVGDSLIIGLGCYVGEVIVRLLGGRWSVEGKPEINGLGQIQAVFPLEKVKKRFQNGSEDSLISYWATVERYSRRT